jgi:trigger factor
MISDENDPESSAGLGDSVDEAPEHVVETLEEHVVETLEEPKRKLDMTVAINETGPCKKHVKIAIARDEIDRQFEESLTDLRKDAVVPGFRPGRAPKQLVIKRFKKEVSNQVKSKLLMAALQQIDDDYKLDPITQPRLDVEAIELPEKGPMNFELDVEVRPQFDLPNYKGFKIRRPIIQFSERDVDINLNRVLEEYAELAPKLDGAAEIGDDIVADLVFRRRDGQLIGEVKEVEFRLQPELRFQNGSVPGMGAGLKGARPGDVREVAAKLGSAVEDPSLRGETVTLQVKVQDLKYLRLPDVTPEFVEAIGFTSAGELREWVRGALNRKVDAEQRRAVRRQLVDLLLRQSPFDLPTDLVSREEKNTIARLVDQLKREGMTDKEIKAHSAEIRANAHETTLASLKELLILYKIADAEGITVEEADVEIELQAMAAQAGESVRRVRARMEKEGGGESLTTQILEQKVIRRILEYSQVEDVPVAAGAQAPEVETADFALIPASASSAKEGAARMTEQTESAREASEVD